MKNSLLLIMFILTGCCTYVQTDLNAYGVVRHKKEKSGIFTYRVEIDPETKINYQTFNDSLSIGDTILIKSYLTK